MDLSPVALRTAYADGRVTPVDVVKFVLSRLGDDDQDNVWISTVDPEMALAAAEALMLRIGDLDALPLFGLPFSVKDNIDVSGVPTTAGCPAFQYKAKTSAFVVDEALKAGAIYIGKTNLDQFATGLVGVRSPYGTPRNPFNPEYIPGGSSSGAGVSISTGVVSFAFGTDTGGSGRVPASYNGIAGLKPAPGLLSRRGLVFACRSIDTPSVFTKTAGDACTVFNAVNAHDPLDAYGSAPAIINGQKALPSRPKIAVPQKSDLQFFGNAEIETLFEAATDHAQTLFGQVSEVDFTPFMDLNDIMFFGPLLAERDVSVGAFIDENYDAIDPTVCGLVRKSKQMSAADAYRAQYKILDTKVATQSFWDQYDILMVPTVGTLVTTADLLDDPVLPNFKNGFYTNYANPLGLSAIATPFARTKSGVPWGVTLLVNHSSLDDLAAIADQFSHSVA
ncbi:allophanate hydrolase [Pacificibacter sp. AS14]|uniref:allophanate hydrolase n=1 Tax=Pacificibacter sp. AS14 TaxID=3135785 RepID=UPI00316E7F38